MALKKHRALRWILGAPIALIALCVVAWIGVVIAGRVRLQNARDAFAAAGHPTTIAELLGPAVPADVNLAPLITQARTIFEATQNRTEASGEDPFERINELNAELTESPSERTRDLEEIIEELETLFAQPDVVAVTGLLDEAPQRSAYAPDIDFAAGPNYEYPDPGAIRTFVRVFTARARVAIATTQEPEAVWADIGTARHLSNLVGHVPTLLNNLTSIACLSVSQDSLKAALEAGMLPPEDSDLLQREIRMRESDTHNFLRAIDSDRLMIIDWFARDIDRRDDWLESYLQDLSGKRYSNGRARLRVLGYFARPLAKMDLAHAHRHYFAVANVLENEPQASQIARLQALEDDLHESR